MKKRGVVVPVRKFDLNRSTLSSASLRSRTSSFTKAPKISSFGDVFNRMQGWPGAWPWTLSHLKKKRKKQKSDVEKSAVQAANFNIWFFEHKAEVGTWSEVEQGKESLQFQRLRDSGTWLLLAFDLQSPTQGNSSVTITIFFSKTASSSGPKPPSYCLPRRCLRRQTRSISPQSARWLCSDRRRARLDDCRCPEDCSCQFPHRKAKSQSGLAHSGAATRFSANSE